MRMMSEVKLARGVYPDARRTAGGSPLAGPGVGGDFFAGITTSLGIQGPNKSVAFFECKRDHSIINWRGFRLTALEDRDGMPAKKKDAAAELAEKLVLVLEAQRGLGDTAYPLPLRRLAELTDLTAPPELLQAALKKKPIKDRVVRGHANHLNAPVALAEDMDRLAASPLLLEFVLEQVCTPTRPTCAVTKLKTKVPTKLKPRFETALNRQIKENTLPESVAVVIVKKKQHFHLRRHELPRPPEEKLAENLVRVLKAQRALGDSAYPLLLARLVELTEAEVSGSLAAKAVAQPAFKQAVVLGLKGKDASKSPVALLEDQELLAESPLLLETALTEVRTDDSQIVTVANLKTKVTSALWPLVDHAIRRKVQMRSLPSTVGCLIQKKQPVLFLMNDVIAGRTGSTSPLPPVDQLSGQVARDGPEGDFARQFDEAFRRLEQQARSPNYVSLVQLRRALESYDRRTFDAELRKLREVRRYTLSAAEGRQGITPEEREAGVVEDGALLLYVSRKLP